MSDPWQSQTPLSNSDFRKLLSTPRPGDQPSYLQQQQQKLRQQQQGGKPAGAKGGGGGGFKKPAPRPKPKRAGEEDEDDGGPKYRCVFFVLRSAVWRRFGGEPVAPRLAHPSPPSPPPAARPKPLPTVTAPRSGARA